MFITVLYKNRQDCVEPIIWILIYLGQEIVSHSTHATSNCHERKIFISLSKKGNKILTKPVPFLKGRPGRVWWVRPEGLSGCVDGGPAAGGAARREGAARLSRGSRPARPGWDARSQGTLRFPGGGLWTLYSRSVCAIHCNQTAFLVINKNAPNSLWKKLNAAKQYGKGKFVNILRKTQYFISLSLHTYLSMLGSKR